MKYYSKMPVGILEVTKEAYEASLTESISLTEGVDRNDIGVSSFKNCPGLISLDGAYNGSERATIKDKDGILKKINYFSSEGVRLLEEIIAWNESSMLSRMQDKIAKLEASLTDTKNLLAEANNEIGEQSNQIKTLQMERDVKSFLLTVSRKNWKGKSICRDAEDNFLYLHSCTSTNCEGCDRFPLGRVIDYL